MSTQAADSIETAVEWLRALNREIGILHEGSGIMNPAWRETLRGLTTEEWKKVCELVVQHDLPVNLHAAVYGFVITVHATSNIPEIPEVLLTVEHGQLPFPAAGKGFAGQDEVLQEISQLTHRARNQELLAWYGFEPLQDPATYSY